MSYIYDLVLQNGTVNDPANNLSGRYDLAVKDGKIAEIAPSISAGAVV